MKFDLEFAGYFLLYGRKPDPGRKDYRKFIHLSDDTESRDMIPLYKPGPALQHGAPAVQLIVSAACKFGDLVICGHRHFDKIMGAQLNALEKAGVALDYNNHVQGFIDNRGDFYDRKDSLRIAIDAGQINFRRLKSSDGDELYSEDLY